MNSEDALAKFKSIRIVKLDNLYGQVLCDTETMNAVIKKFSVEVPNARFMAKVKAGVWDGKIRFIAYGGKFPIGLLRDVHQTLIEWNANLPKEEKKEVVVDEAFDIMDNVEDLESVTHEHLNTGEINKKTPADDEKDEIGVTFWPPHDYQWDLVKKLLDNKQCIIESATSSGKTLMLGMLCNYLHRTEKVENILVIVPRVDLVVQGQRDLTGYGIPPEWIGMVFGGIKEYGRKITISTWQSMDLDDVEYYKNFECLVVDECFKGDTKIETEYGYKEIKNIKKGESVWSYNFETTQKELKSVVNVYRNRTISNKLIEFEFENGKKITCTPNHLFFTKNRGWVQAKNLDSDDEL